MEVAHTGKQESVEDDAAGLNQSVNTIESSEKPEGAIATDNSKESSGLNTAKSSKKRKLEEITNEENLAAPVMSDASPQEATEQHQKSSSGAVSPCTSSKRRKLNFEEIEDVKEAAVGQVSQKSSKGAPSLLASKYLKEDEIELHQEGGVEEDCNGAFNMQPLQDSLPQASQAQEDPQLEQQLSQGQILAEVVALQTVIPCFQEALSKSREQVEAPLSDQLVELVTQQD